MTTQNVNSERGGVVLHEMVRCPNCGNEHAITDGNFYCGPCSARWRRWGMHDKIDKNGVQSTTRASNEKALRSAPSGSV